MFHLYCYPLASKADLKKRTVENQQTENVISKLETQMQDFWGKGVYHPTNQQQRDLHQFYKLQLKRLPYYALPDGRFDNFHIYIRGSFPRGYATFYDSREKFDCLSILAITCSIIQPSNFHIDNFPNELDVGKLNDILFGKRQWEFNEMKKQK